ncbi:hypothetical protein SmJEL517_g03158 [Synchytrium microbalum]|uniref:Beta-lactamase-related domain-containing protein n=1 Tax=Synchytrium microbalum TaxID=1806994 RepID=A0A507C460_9FUNG|nr:uncharacterized protein SmJEL517_g03158 [Synchytrium microbalum]TPX34168.1 hypothetical protein SmJEL517_g03158 [Synchytrium microbalum]
MTISSLQRVLDDAVVSDLVGVAGIVYYNGKVIFEGVAGNRSSAGDEKLKITDHFRIASMTKAITSVAILQLIEKGKLVLDQDSGTILSFMKDIPVLEGFDADKKPILRPKKGPVTIRQLLTHSAGLTYGFLNGMDGEYYANTGYAPIGAGKRAAFANIFLARDPGTQWEYGINTDVLGLVVEKVTGQSLAVYMLENILNPLKMNSTGWKAATYADDLVPVHARLPDGSLAVIPFEFPQDFDFEAGGGGLYSTVRDYIRFASMILNKGTLDGVQILKAETVALASQNHLGDLRPMALKSYDKTLTLDIDLMSGYETTWGLGFLINTEDIPNMRSAGSLAWAGIFNTYFWIDPKNNVTAVFATQLLPFVDTKAVEQFTKFERAVYVIQ